MVFKPQAPETMVFSQKLRLQNGKTAWPGRFNGPVFEPHFPQPRGQNVTSGSTKKLYGCRQALGMCHMSSTQNMLWLSQMFARRELRQECMENEACGQTHLQSLHAQRSLNLRKLQDWQRKKLLPEIYAKASWPCAWTSSMRWLLVSGRHAVLCSEHQ